MSEAKHITVERLMSMMRKLEVGEVIGLAADELDDGTAESWFGLMRIDLSRLDEESKVWVLQYFGGNDNPAILTDYDDEKFLREDLCKALADRSLLQQDGKVLMDINDYNDYAKRLDHKHLYVMELEEKDKDGRWYVKEELNNRIMEDYKPFADYADTIMPEPNQRIVVRQIADSVDWRTVTDIDSSMYENVYTKEVRP